MYYEARVYSIVHTTDAYEAAKMIKKENHYFNEVVTWVSRDKNFKIFAVADRHLGNPLLELAILRKLIDDTTETYCQVESITSGWIESSEELEKYLEESETSTWIMNAQALLIIDEPKGVEQANFICGCCGEWFKGNVKE